MEAKKLKQEPKYIILGTNNGISVLVDSESQDFKPLIMRLGEIYDPARNYKPLHPKFRQKSLSPAIQAEAADLINALADRWSVPVVTPVEAEPAATPALTPQLSTPQETLDALIARSVAEISAKSVVETAKPVIDKFIRETYGLIPKVLEVKSDAGTFKVNGATHSKFETILSLVNADIPVFLTGPAGCGKNVLCQQVADALGKEFYFSNAVTQEYKLAGFVDANGRYHETQFYKAFTGGGCFYARRD